MTATILHDTERVTVANLCGYTLIRTSNQHGDPDWCYEDGTPVGTSFYLVLQAALDMHRFFWARVDKTDGCWLWTGATNGIYGRVIGRNRKWRIAHRVSYELNVGPIPEGLEIDHLCRVTLCVRPDHLEPVTHAENMARGNHPPLKTHCPRGHPYSQENTRVYIHPRTGHKHRICLTCQRATTNRRRAMRHRAKGAA